MKITTFLFLFVANCASAQVTLFTDYPPSTVSGVQVIPHEIYGLRFTTEDQPITISSLKLNLWAANPQGADLAIYTSASGSPAEKIQQFSNPVFSNAFGIDYVFTALTATMLSPNTEYVFVFNVPDGQINWMTADAPFSSNYVSDFVSIMSDDFGVTWKSPYSFIGSIEASGIISVPEPSSFLLFFFGILALLPISKSRTRRCTQRLPASRFLLVATLPCRKRATGSRG